MSDLAPPRIAILVLGCREPVYQRCIQTIRATWGQRPSPHSDVFYVYGAHSAAGSGLVDLGPLFALHHAEPPRRPLADGEVWASNELLLCGAADVFRDQWHCVLRKRLLAFADLALQRGYDFIYNVCASSYVDVAGLERYVAGLPRSGVYHGTLAVHAASGFPFISGASFLLSRDLAAALAQNAAPILARYPDGMPDDVAIGHFIASRYGGAPVAEIARRIAEGRPSTDNQTFVIPMGGGSADFVSISEFRQVAKKPLFHYHFNSGRMWEMENFHRRYFASEARDEVA